jgi:hypothetical protein
MDLLLSPSIAFSVMLSSLYGAVFHFIWGKRWRDLALYWLVAVVGFGIGHALSSFVGFSIYMIGVVRVVEGTVVSWVCLFVARWLNV